MKKFNELLNETLDSQDLEELESAADLFQYGVEQGYYSLRQVKEFNKNYWQVKDIFLVDTIKDEFKTFNKLDLLNIISKADVNIKGDTRALICYVNNIIRTLRKKQRIA